MVEALIPLEQLGWIICTDPNRNARSRTYAINPTIQHSESAYRERVIQARQEIQDSIHEAATAKGYDIPRKLVRGATG
jgi:hypothetical protein